MLEFWALTPRETWAAIEAAQKAQAREDERAMMMAWATAALSRAKRMPSLREWLHPAPREPKSLKQHQEEFAELKQLMGKVHGRGD